MAWMLVRSTGWAGALGLVAALLAAGVTSNAWIGLIAGLVVGFGVYAVLKPSSPA